MLETSEGSASLETSDRFASERGRVPPPAEDRPTNLATSAAARRIVEALVDRGIDTFFGIPGGPACALFEAIRVTKGARLVASRHETHAGFAACTYYRVTGRIPVVVVTAGPGITHAATGIASASFERVPMLVLAGDVAWASLGACLAQDSGPGGLDAEAFLSTVTRAQVRIARAQSAVAQTFRALAVATDPRSPGPALVMLPIDLATAPARDLSLVISEGASISPPPLAAVKEAWTWVRDARRPLVVLGAGTRRHAAAVRALVDALGVPFVTTPSAKGVVSEEHPCSLRNGGMAASHWARRYTSEPLDVTLVLGTDLDDTSVGPTPYISTGGRLIHVDLDSSVFGRNFPTALGVQADLGVFADALRRIAGTDGPCRTQGRLRLDAVRAASPFDVPDAATDPRTPIAPHRAILDLERAAGPCRFITDIGEHMVFALHYLTARSPDAFYIQLAFGSMGSGIAGAIGLATADPGTRVVCICGDGGMQMSGGELLLALKERLPIVFAVFNDRRYNMVYHGMRQIFGDADGWEMPEVDYAALARAMGIPSLEVRCPGEITKTALDALCEAKGCCVLDIRIDPAVRVRGGGRVEALQSMSMRAAPQPLEPSP